MEIINESSKDYLFRIGGVVTHGRQLGRTVGMPTANILPTEDISDIPCGVYAASVSVRSRIYNGITHIGTRPSVDKDTTVTVETHIFDFSEDIYGEEVLLTLYLYIRGTVSFNSLEEVKEQVDTDIRAAKTYFTCR